MKCAVYLLLAMLPGFVILRSAFAEPVAEATPTVETLVRPDMLNVELAYLEHRLGPAKYVDGFSDGMKDRTYIVGACKLHAFTDGRKVTAYGVELAAGCSFHLGAFMGIEGLEADQVTMGQIAKTSAPGGVVEFSTTCLQDCDNRADPVVAMRWEGAHADDFMQIESLTWATTDAALKAWDDWAAALTKIKGGRSRDFTCPSFSNVEPGIEAFDAVKPAEIIVGHYDPTEEMFAKICDKSTPRKYRTR